MIPWKNLDNQLMSFIMLKKFKSTKSNKEKRNTWQTDILN